MINESPTTAGESQQPLVTIIMNCFNGEKYLREAIGSVFAQTYHNWEIIFWDNQSTDRSAEIFKSYGDSRLKYFYAPKHTLVYEARNNAINKSSGEFFAFLDVDDWWEPTKLEKQIVLFADPEVGLVCGNCWIVSERKKKRWKSYEQPVPTGWVLNDLLKDYFVRLPTLVVRHSALRSLDYACDSSLHIIGDFDLVIRLAIHWKLDYVEETVASYRQHSGNESLKYRDLYVEEMEWWLKEMSGVESVRSCSNWDLVNNNYIYLNAVNQVLLGNKTNVYRLSKELPWSKPKIKLLMSLFFPTRYIQQRFEH